MNTMFTTATRSSKTQLNGEWNLSEGIEKFSECLFRYAYGKGIIDGQQKDEKLFNKLIKDQI